jgi:hypothetical protein
MDPDDMNPPGDGDGHGRGRAFDPLLHGQIQDLPYK